MNYQDLPAYLEWVLKSSVYFEFKSDKWLPTSQDQPVWPCIFIGYSFNTEDMHLPLQGKKNEKIQTNKGDVELILSRFELLRCKGLIKVVQPLYILQVSSLADDLPDVTESIVVIVNGEANRLLLTKEILDFCEDLPIHNTVNTKVSSNDGNETVSK